MTASKSVKTAVVAPVPSASVSNAGTVNPGGVSCQLAWGLAIGVPAALAGGRLIASQLFGVKSWDPPVFAAAVAVLIVTALVAGLVPARRAATIDPLPALRSE